MKVKNMEILLIYLLIEVLVDCKSDYIYCLSIVGIKKKGLGVVILRVIMSRTCSWLSH